MKLLNKMALVLVLVGGINWGLVGLLNFNLVSAIFGQMTFLAGTIYTLVGISALYLALAELPR